MKFREFYQTAAGLDYAAKMEIALGLARLYAEDPARELYSSGVSVDAETRRVTYEGTAGADELEVWFCDRGRGSIVLANMLLCLMKGEDVLADVGRDDESSKLYIIESEAVFEDADVIGLHAYGASDEQMSEIGRCIIGISSGDAEVSRQSVDRLIELCRCEYRLKCVSPDGSAAAEATVEVPGGEVSWPDPAGLPVMTLSDGEEYSFERVFLKYSPGSHEMTVTAVQRVSVPEPAPAPDPVTVPDPVPTPEPAPAELRHVTVGIDLGTEKTCVAMTDGELVELEDDAIGISSFMLYNSLHDCEIGRSAKSKAAAYPEAAVSAFKRQIGDPSAISVTARDGTRIMNTGMEASGRFLSAIRQRMEELGMYIDRLVITTPADFNEVKRAETRKAAQISGFSQDDVRLLEEPTAAAVYYGSECTSGITAVYDLGGGTFDVCIIRSGADGSEILGKGGELNLGGYDFTGEIMKIFMKKAAADGVQLPSESDRLTDRDAAGFLFQLRDIAEHTKILLSVNERATMSVTYGGSHISYDITRDEFEQALAPYLARIRNSVEDVFCRSGYSTSQVDRVIIIGGSTLIPCVERQIREELFPGCRRFLCDDRITPVARGAAVFARSAWDRGGAVTGRAPEILPQNMTSRDLGVITAPDIRNPRGRFSSIIDAGTVYSENGCEGVCEYHFIEDSGTHLTVGLYSRNGGDRNAQPSIFAAKNPVKKIGELHFDDIPAEGLLRRTLRVQLSLDRDGILSANAQIIADGRVEKERDARIEAF